jgi:hypothetical protein
MHTTEAGERRKALKRDAKEMARKALTLREAAKILPELKMEAMRYQVAAKKTLARANALKLETRIEDIHVWEQNRVTETKMGPKTYTYYVASWREGQKMKNVYLGSAQKMTRKHAMEKAKALKVTALMTQTSRRGSVSQRGDCLQELKE